jgi:hypothetical protein
MDTYYISTTIFQQLLTYKNANKVFFGGQSCQNQHSCMAACVQFYAGMGSVVTTSLLCW